MGALQAKRQSITTLVLALHSAYCPLYTRTDWYDGLSTAIGNTLMGLQIAQQQKGCSAKYRHTGFWDESLAASRLLLRRAVDHSTLFVVRANPVFIRAKSAQQRFRLSFVTVCVDQVHFGMVLRVVLLRDDFEATPIFEELCRNDSGALVNRPALFAFASPGQAIAVQIRSFCPGHSITIPRAINQFDPTVDLRQSQRMKYPTRRFKSLAVALKEIEPFVRDGQHLETGKPFKQLGGMRSREVLANLMVCIAYNFASGEKLSFCSDPTGGDGIIYDESSQESWQTEHVMVASFGSDEANDSEKAILEQVLQKYAKGAQYARGKTLIVLLNSKGQKWHPNRVAQQLPDPLHFDTVWVVGLQKVEDGQYVYAVTNLNPQQGRDAPIFHVRVKTDFESWEVTRIQ